MSIFVSFLILVLNLVILGVVYWGVQKLLAVIPDSFLPPPIKSVLSTIIMIIIVIVAVIWIANWVMVALAGSSGFGFPSLIPYTHRK